LTEPPLVLDADLLSHFSCIDRLDILEKLYAKKMVILDEVMEEINRREELGNRVQSCIDNSSMTRISMVATSSEAVELARLRGEGRLGKGEAACMAYLKYNLGSLGSNNLSDIKKMTVEKNITLITTEDVLYQALQKKIITIEEAENVWAAIITKGRELPTKTFSERLSMHTSKN